MICRKCGATLPDNSIRCSNCGIKVNIICPECKTIVPFGEQYCTHCGFELIKICPSCNASNSYTAKECRKCKTPLLKSETLDNNLTNEISDSNAEVVAEISTEQKTEYNKEIKPTEFKELDIENPDIESILDEFNSEEEDTKEEEIKNEEIEEWDESSDSAVEEDIEKILQNEPQETEQKEDLKIQDEQTTEKDVVIQDEDEKRIINKDSVISLLSKIKTSINKHIIAITGPEGSGKSAVIRQTRELLNKEGYMTLYGSCSPLSQITSFGFFQDAFLRLLGFPPYRNSIDSFMKDFKKSEFNAAFNFLKPNELSLFLNLLYPTQKDCFENILENKQLMFSIIEKILKAFLTSANMVIIIDNFDLLDGASYDFINYIAGKNFFNNRLKLIAAYQEDKPVQSFFDMVRYDIFETIRLEKFTKYELPDVINKAIGIDITNISPENYLDEVIARADGNAIRLEQDIAYLFDINNLYLKDNQIQADPTKQADVKPSSLEDLIKLRIGSLPPEVKNVLFMAAILGYRFATDVICHSVTMPAKNTLNILELLKNELYIVPVDDFTGEFKSLAIWKLIYKEAQNDLLFKENSERLYAVLKSRVLSSNIQKLISCSEALSKKEEFVIWQDTADITAKLGDTNLFVIAQKQCLKILEECDMPNADNVREIIYEQIGKLLSKKSPAEAVSYLANVLDSKIKESATNKIIDLSGYFINSCYLTGNYFGVVESVDAIIKNLKATDAKADEIQIALIKTRKLEALLNIGNSEQITNIIKEDILIKINNELETKQLDKSYRNLLIDAWFLSNLVLAKAYALQGSHEIFTVTASVKEFINNHQIKSRYFTTRIALAEAFAHSTIGETSISHEILMSIKNDNQAKVLDKKLLCEWNLINIINKVLEHKLDGIKSELFDLAEFANNINEHSVKNFAKLILGYVFKEEGNISKAINIYNDEITYFAKEKIAIGAMLAWALIARANIDTGDLDLALNTATKALDVAKGPKINNYFFMVYFQKLIAGIYLLKGDLIAVKMYLEKALSLAKQENLKFLLSYLYLDYGRYMEEYMKAKQTYTNEYVKQTLETYERAFNTARECRIKWIKDTATKAHTSFKTFCQLNSIEFK